MRPLEVQWGAFPVSGLYSVPEPCQTDTTPLNMRGNSLPICTFCPACEGRQESFRLLYHTSCAYMWLALCSLSPAKLLQRSSSGENVSTARRSKELVCFLRSTFSQAKYLIQLLKSRALASSSSSLQPVATMATETQTQVRRSSTLTAVESDMTRINPS